jgi:hypothetical protein
VGENIIKLSRLQAGERPEAPVITPDPNADGAALLDEVYAFLGEFISYPNKETHVAHVLWIAHCFLMDCWDSTPRLTFLSPEPGSGKSRALEVTETLVPTPLLAANITPSALFRKAGEELVTLLIDEADTTFSIASETSEKLRKFLNASHRRGYTSTLCVKAGSAINLEETPCFVPVALAALALSHMPETVKSRSIIIPMRRRSPAEAIKPFRRRKHGPIGNALRDRLYSWAAAAQDSITARLDSDDENEIEMPGLIADRDADVWEPLFLIADAAGGEWPDRARCNAVTLVKAYAHASSTASWGINLLSDLRAILKDADTKFTSAILDELHKKDESPWNDIKGKPLSDRGLAERLKPYGIRSKLIRIGGTVARGYAKADFLDAWARYLPPGT